MYKITTLKDCYGTPIGFIWTYEDGKKELRDKYGRILGFYYPIDDTTRNEYGAILGYGDFLTTLLHND